MNNKTFGEKLSEFMELTQAAVHKFKVEYSPIFYGIVLVTSYFTTILIAYLITKESPFVIKDWKDVGKQVFAVIMALAAAFRS
jgi:hypothetical protein